MYLSGLSNTADLTSIASALFSLNGSKNKVAVQYLGYGLTTPGLMLSDISGTQIGQPTYIVNVYHGFQNAKDEIDRNANAAPQIIATAAADAAAKSDAAAKAATAAANAAKVAADAAAKANAATATTKATEATKAAVAADTATKAAVIANTATKAAADAAVPATPAKPTTLKLEEVNSVN